MGKRDDTLHRLNEELKESRVLMERVPAGGVNQLFHGGWSLPGYDTGRMSTGFGSERFFELPVPGIVPNADHQERSHKWQSLIDTLRQSQAHGLIQKLRGKQKTPSSEERSETQEDTPLSFSPE
jgi:hypothetical protein